MIPSSMKPAIRFLTALFFVGLVSAANAVALEFRVLGWNAPVTDLFFSSAGREVPLTAGISALSARHALQDNDRVLQLYRLDSSRKRLPVAAIPVPRGLTHAILLLHTDAAGNCTGRWLDDSPVFTPAGSMRIYNLAGKPVALSTGKDDVRTLDPGADTLTRLPSGLRAIPVRIAARLGDNWMPAMSISQPVRARLRFIVLIRDARPSLENPDAILEWMAFHEAPPASSAEPVRQPAQG
jgi:hypothetical protein